MNSSGAESPKSGGAWPSGGQPSAAEKLAIVERVAASSQFRRTARLRRFLFYVCDRTLKNELEDLREYRIGCSVFDRPAGYNPSEDNIVRVEARQLRKRLAEYFATDGKDEPVVILIPKGAYVPMFVRRELVAPEPTELLDVQPASGPAPGVPGRPPEPRLRIAILAGAVLAAVAAWIWAWWYVQERRGQPVVEGEGGRAPALVFPWTALFDGNQQTNLVLADSCLALLQDVTRQRVTLADYMSRTHVAKLLSLEKDAAVRSALELIAGRHYTSLADASLVRKIVQFAPDPGRGITVSFARNVNIRDFRTNNVILVGSSHSNPWVELFDPARNFQLQLDPATRKIVVRNKTPREGEQAIYVPGDHLRSGEAYAVVALVPNLTRSGHVLIIEGTTMEGTEAGADFLSDPGMLTAALSRIGLGGGEKTRYFELLLKSRALGGTSKDTEPVAHRTIE